VVPATHRARADAALQAIQNQVNNNRRLQNYFRDTAPGGTNNTLSQVASRAIVWEVINEGSLGEAWGSNDIAYDPFMYRMGWVSIAATLLHEMGHLAGFLTEAECEQAPEMGWTYAPFLQSITPRQGRVGDEITIQGISFGASQTDTDHVEFNGVDAGKSVSWTWSHAGGEIHVRVPAGATTGPVVIINNNVRSNGVNFTVLG
jgi:hypothetical protein